MGPSPNAAYGSNGRDASESEEDGSAPVALEPATIEAIGAALQTYYQALVDEPLPSRLVALLEELELKKDRGE